MLLLCLQELNAFLNIELSFFLLAELVLHFDLMPLCFCVVESQREHQIIPVQFSGQTVTQVELNRLA